MEILLSSSDDKINFDELAKREIENKNEEIKNLYAEVFSSQYAKLLILFWHSNNLIDQLEVDEFAKHRINSQGFSIKNQYEIDPSLMEHLQNQCYTIDNQDPRIVATIHPLKYTYVPSLMKKVYQSKLDKLLIIDPHTSKTDLFFSICLLPSMTYLKSLTFCNIELKTDLLLIMLFKSIGLLKNLESLNISNIIIQNKLISDTVPASESYSEDKSQKNQNDFPNMNYCIRSLALSLVQLENLKTLIMVNNNFLTQYLHFLIFLDINNSNIFTWLPKLSCLKLGVIKDSNNNSKYHNKSLYISSLTMFNNYIKNANEVDIKEYVPGINRNNAIANPYDFSYLDIVCTNLANLEVIQLRNFKNISTTTFLTILDSKRLKEIDLSYNNINSDHFSNISFDNPHPNLSKLQLSGNNLGTYDFFKIIDLFSTIFPNLEVLALDENKFESLGNPDNLRCRSKIRHLYLDRNKIKGSAIIIIKCFKVFLKNLEYLSMKNCQLDDNDFLNIVSSEIIWKIIINIRNNYFFFNSKDFVELKNCSNYFENCKGLFIHSKMVTQNNKLTIPEGLNLNNESLIKYIKRLEKFLIHHKYKSKIY